MRNPFFYFALSRSDSLTFFFLFELVPTPDNLAYDVNVNIKQEIFEWV